MRVLRNLPISRRLWLILLSSMLMLLALTARVLQQIYSALYQAKALKTQYRVESACGVHEVIRSIAEQTNLPALNVAIKAARAGDQGHGLVVVADEACLLAQRTQQPRADVNSMIERLKSKSNAAVNTINARSEASQQTVEQAHKAGESLSQTARSLGNLSNLNASIASATL